MDNQSQIKVFWGPRLDTIVGPHTHPALPSSSDPINLTGVWGITTENVWNCKCHIGEFQRRNQVKISEGKIEDKAGTYGAKCLKIEGKARTEIERGRDLGREFNEPLPRKFFENLNLKVETLRQSGAQFKQHSISFLAFIIFFFNFIVFFFDERGDCGQAAEGGDLSRGGYRVQRGGFGEYVVPLKRCANSKIKMVLSWMFFYLATMYLNHIKHTTYFYNNNLTGCVLKRFPPQVQKNVRIKIYPLHSMASFRHCMIHLYSYVSGNNRAAPTGWAYGGDWNRNDGNALTEGEARIEQSRG